MVAIKNLSIASAVLLSVADQGLAAPINTRAPKKGIKTGLAHHALSVGGQVGAAFAGARRDVEERSPKKGIKTGFAHHALSVAGNVGAAFAGNARRDVEERSPKKGIKTGFAHHALSVAGQVGSAFAGGARDVEDLDERDFEEELDERDIDELYELATRSPKKGIKTGFAHHALSVAGNVGAAFAGNARRDVDELDERDFEEELDERDFDEELDERDVEEFEIYTRSPRKGIKTGLAHHALSVGGQVGAAFAGGARRDVDELDERDIDELYELATRSPKKGIKTGFAHHALSVAGQVGSAFAGGARRDIDDEELVARALEELDERDLEDIYARYFDEAEDFEY